MTSDKERTKMLKGLLKDDKPHLFKFPIQNTSKQAYTYMYILKNY